MLPSQLQLENSIENLVDDAVKQIENVKTKLDLYKTSVKKTDKYIHTGEFSSRYFSSEPFYVWKNDEYKDTISKLLSGQKIVLRADVKKSAPDKDAIKFSVIDLHFKTNNKTLQSQMDNLLIGFDVMATHLGNSYYRYADKIYIITSDSQTISYSWETNAAGEPIRRNNVFDKIKEGDLMLSPYTLWELKIINSTRKVTFRDLEVYKDNVDLELSGYGSYVVRNENGFKFSPKAYSSVGKFDEVDICVDSEARNSSECTDMIGRMIRSAQLVEGYDGYMTNGAAPSLWSPLNYACNFLKMHIALNFVQFFINDEESTNVKVNSRLTTKQSTHLASGFTNRKIETAENSIGRVELARSEFMKHEENHRCNCINMDHTENFSFRDLGKSFLPNAEKEESSCFNQCLEVNCTLLLADVVARTVTGEKYDRAFEECLLSPKEKLQMRLNEFAVRSEDDARLNLCNLSRMTDDKESSWLNRVKNYAKSMLQYLGFNKNLGPDDFVEDIRNLFS
ncbi:hypothetical protein HNY73_007703 [Argiope bruennichi]|uniref:Uncharacterized protein n=1 Tax=Argiope bruennichi TaxID=94029 RepID=A0A8T0FK90_ARGBR|nr:hypothetical protein HNY73_007703 [Argiope bruennichi]